MKKSTPLQAALSYATRGWLVFPLHSIKNAACTCGHQDCSSPGKHPLIKNGVKEATREHVTIRTWWKMRPWANVAIAAGQESGLVVLDVDSHKGGDDSLAELEAKHGRIETVEALTGGGGRHLYFAHPKDGPIRNKVALAPGLDVRGEGGYVVAPSSLHVSGRHYEWEAAHHPDDTPLAPIPPWLLDLVREIEKPEPAPAVGARIPEGERNTTLTSLAGAMRRRGMSYDAILAALRAENASKCDPPLPDQEVERGK